MTSDDVEGTKEVDDAEGVGQISGDFESIVVESTDGVDSAADSDVGIDAVNLRRDVECVIDLASVGDVDCTFALVEVGHDFVGRPEAGCTTGDRDLQSMIENVSHPEIVTECQRHLAVNRRERNQTISDNAVMR